MIAAQASGLTASPICSKTSNAFKLPQIQVDRGAPKPATGQNCRKTTARIRAERTTTSHKQGMVLASSQKATAGITLTMIITTAGQYFTENCFATAASRTWFARLLLTRRTRARKIDNSVQLIFSLAAMADAGGGFHFHYGVLYPEAQQPSKVSRPDRFAEKLKICSRSLQ